MDAVPCSEWFGTPTMRTKDEIERLASVTKAEAETLDSPLMVRLAMASRAAQLYWVLGDGFSTSQQMKMEMLAAELSDSLKTNYAPPRVVLGCNPVTPNK